MGKNLRGGLNNDNELFTVKKKRKRQKKWHDEEADNAENEKVEKQIEPPVAEPEVPATHVEQVDTSDQVVNPISHAIKDTLQERINSVSWLVVLVLPLFVTASSLIKRTDWYWACLSWVVAIVFAWPMRKAISTVLTATALATVWLRVAISFCLLLCLSVCVIEEYWKAGSWCLLLLLVSHTAQLCVNDLRVAGTQVTVIEIE